METITWHELIVTDDDGNDTGTLGGWLDDAGSVLDEITVIDGRIDTWEQYFISAPGEEPDWDTPRVDVDWTGFEEALISARTPNA